MRRTASRAGIAPIAVDWHSTTVNVHSDSTRLLHYLASQHRVAAGAQEVRGSPLDLVGVVAPDLVADLRAAVPPDGVHRREAFRGEWYQCWKAGPRGLVMVAEPPNTRPHVLATADFRSWAVIADDEDGLCVAATRTVRELVREDNLRRAGLMFHAACAVLTDGIGLLITGAKGAGKTSSAVRIGAAGGRAVGTDRTLVVPEWGGWLGVGLPMSTRLAAGVVDAMGLRDRLRHFVPIRARDGGNSFAARDVANGTAEKVSLSNAEAGELLGCEFVAATPLTWVCALVSVPDQDMAVRPLDAADAEIELRHHLLAPDPDYRTRWLSEDPARETGDAAVARLRALVRQVPVTLVSWDPRRHCDEYTPQRFEHALNERTWRGSARFPVTGRSGTGSESTSANRCGRAIR